MGTSLIKHYTPSGRSVFSMDDNSEDGQGVLFHDGMEERYASLFENIKQGYYETDLSGNLSFFNNFLCKMLGYTKEELTGKNLMQFLGKEDSERIDAALKGILKTEKPRLGLIFQVIRKDGVKRQIGTSICLNRDIWNKKIGFRGIASDISERKSQEDQLNRTRRLESIGQLAAGIAHEINTPIQYIGDNIQFIKDSFKDIELLLNGFLALLEEVKEGLITGSATGDIERTIRDTDSDYIIEEIPRAIDQSLEGLKHVSKIVSAMKQFCHPGIENKKGTDINKSIDNIITVARNEWKYDADIITDFDPALPLVPCLPGEINQVILNLIVNASDSIKEAKVRGGSEKGCIKVSTRHDKSWAEIRVSDSGRGIPEEVRARIFDPFFTTKEVGKGTGQGLAISHSVVVNNHGGTLRFETEMGKGTTMIVRLPLGDEDE